MPNQIIKRDENRVTVLAGVTDDSNQFITMLPVDPATGRLLVSATGSGGGGIGYESPTSGAIDGSNTVFTFDHTPIALVANGATIFQNDTDNVTGYYTRIGTTVTLSFVLFPPSSLKGQYNA